MNYEKLEKKLYNTLKFKEKFNKLCEKLLVCYDELNIFYMASIHLFISALFFSSQIAFFS